MTAIVSDLIHLTVLLLHILWAILNHEVAKYIGNFWAAHQMHDDADRRGFVLGNSSFDDFCSVRRLF